MEKAIPTGARQKGAASPTQRHQSHIAQPPRQEEQGRLLEIEVHELKLRGKQGERGHKDKIHNQRE